MVSRSRRRQIPCGTVFRSSPEVSSTNSVASFISPYNGAKPQSSELSFKKTIGQICARLDRMVRSDHLLVFKVRNQTVSLIVFFEQAAKEVVLPSPLEVC